MAFSHIKIETECRTCIVNGRAALFHRWSDKSEIVAPSVMVGGHTGGVVSCTVGIIEYIENGDVHECWPSEIRFTDTAEKISDMEIKLGENDDIDRIVKSHLGRYNENV